MLLEDFADFGELLRSGPFGGESLQQEATGGAFKGAIDQVRDQRLLDLLTRDASLIYVRVGGLIADHQALLDHDLHEFENRGVAGPLGLFKDLLNFPYGAGAALPEDAENGEL